MRAEPERYTVKVNGNKVKLEEIRVSALPFNRVWPGKQRDISQSEIAYMLRIHDDEPVFIEVTPVGTFKRVDIRPYSKNIEYTCANGGISFEVKKHGQYTVEFDGEHFAIHLFFDPVRDFGEYGKPTISFGPGIHNAGLIKVKSNDRIYIDKNAVVYGSIVGIDVDNVKIYGYGILNAGWEIRREKHGDIGWDDESCFEPGLLHTYGGIRMIGCENITVDGIVVCDPASYAISFYKSCGIDIFNVKVAGLWKYNNDGIDFFNCSEVCVKDCFVRSFDDALCLKGLTAFSEKSVENVLIENCVFWCGWGLTLEMGLASACPEMKNIIYKDCDLIHNSFACLSINNGQWAYIHDVVYENINIEYSKFCKPFVIQKDDSHIYDGQDAVQIPIFARITDGRRNWQGNKAKDEDPRCKISDILYKNISIYADAEIMLKDIVRIQKCMKCSNFSNITFENITVNGTKLSDITDLGTGIDSTVTLR